MAKPKLKNYITIVRELYTVEGTRDYQIIFKNSLGKKVKLVLPGHLMLGQKHRELIEALHRKGFDFRKIGEMLGGKSEHDIAKEIQALEPEKPAKHIAPHLGWQDKWKCFASPTGIIGKHQKKMTLDEKLKASGTLEGAQKVIGEGMDSSASFTLAVGLSLACAMLKFVASDNRLVVFYGPSSIGKTTLLKVMHSIFKPLDGSSSKLLSWKATDAGIGQELSKHRDIPTVIDELALLAPDRKDVEKKIRAQAYDIADRNGKIRHNKAGFSDEMTRTMLATSYEYRIPSEHLGQFVRMVNVPCVSKYGIFGSVPKRFKGNAGMFSAFISKELNAHSGHIGHAFAKRLVSHIEDVGENPFAEELDGKVRKALQCLGVSMNDSLEYRMAEPFGWALVALEMAIEWEILPHSKVKKCLKKVGLVFRRTKNWENEQKKRDEQAFRYLAGWLEENAVCHDSSKRDECDKRDLKKTKVWKQYSKRLGRWEYYVKPKILRKIFARQYSTLENPLNDVMVYLKSNGMLRLNNSGKKNQRTDNSVVKQFKSFKRNRYHAIGASFVRKFAEKSQK